MKKYIIFFLLFILFIAVFICYKGITAYARKKEIETKKSISTIDIENMQKLIENASIETAIYDDISLAIFFDNKCQLSIPYYWEIWEIYDRPPSDLDKPVLTKNDLNHEKNSVSPHECAMLAKEPLLDIAIENTLLGFHFENHLLVIDLNSFDYFDQDGGTLIAFRDPSDKPFQLIIQN